MGGSSITSAYEMKATLLNMATIRRLTMSIMPNAASTKAEARNPISPLCPRQWGQTYLHNPDDAAAKCLLMAHKRCGRRPRRLLIQFIAH